MTGELCACVRVSVAFASILSSSLYFDYCHHIICFTIHLALLYGNFLLWASATL